MKEIQDFMIDYVDGDDQENELDFFDKYKTYIDQQKLGILLHLLSKISNNHHRSSHFFLRIEEILLYFKTEIISNFSNFTIFNSKETKEFF